MDITCRCQIYKCSGGEKCRSNELVNYLKNNKYDYLFYHYDTYILQNQYQFMKNKFYYPHFIDHNIFKDYKLDKIYDILYYGNDWIKIYPFRNRLKKIIQKSCFKTFIINHDKPITGIKLAELINSSWITICTKSLNDILIQKYMEISMSKSVICGNFPDLENKIFGNNMIYVDDSMTDTEILDNISSYLNNKELLLQMSENIYNISCDNFTYEKGLYTFENYIDIITNI
jgi:hypothetical protein